jgi:hypothetical protein
MAQKCRPLNPKSISEGTLDLNVPKTPESSRSAPRRAVSTPEGVEELEQIARSDKSMSKVNAGQKPFTSPCGKKGYIREKYLIKHKRDCDTCKRISKEGDDADSQRQSPGLGRLSTGEDEMKVCSENLDSEFHKLTGDFSPEVQSHERGCKQSGDADASGSARNPGGSRSPTRDHWILPTNTKAGPISAMTTDGEVIDLEDEDYPEGKPSANRSEVRSDSPLIHDRLKEKLDRKLTPTDQRGYVYIFRDPKRPDLLKIGRTKSILQRMSQISYTCGLELVLVKHFEVENYIRTEGLIQAYVFDLCRSYKCEKCKRKHGEWFEIGEECAETYVDRWANFMTQEQPYDAESKDLQSFFRKLVRTRQPLFRDLKNEELREHWTQILSPTAADRFNHRFSIALEIVWKFYWPVNAIIAWTTSFVAIQRPIVFALLSASVGGTFVVVANEYYRTREDSVITAKRARK